MEGVLVFEGIVVVEGVLVFDGIVVVGALVFDDGIGVDGGFVVDGRVVVRGTRPFKRQGSHKSLGADHHHTPPFSIVIVVYSGRTIFGAVPFTPLEPKSLYSISRKESPLSDRTPNKNLPDHP